MEDVFKSVNENQQQNQFKLEDFSVKQIQALRDSSISSTQAVMILSQDKTKVRKEFKNVLKQNMQNYFKRGLQEFDEHTMWYSNYSRSC